MQAPKQESVNMRDGTPMDTIAQATVKEAVALDIPIQFEMESHYMKPMCTMDPLKLLVCDFQEGCHMSDEKDTRDQSAVKVEDLVPCSACCCTISSLYCTFPQCLGCTCSGTALFLQGRCSACKPLDCKDQDKRCCAVVESQEYCVIPTRCIDSQLQCCCVDSRCALPCTNTTPCLVNTMGLTLCADFGCKVGCCASIGTLIPRLKQ